MTDKDLLAGSNVSRAVLPIAEHLFGQLLDLGVITAGWGLSKDVPNRLTPRIELTIELLTLLEANADLRVAASGILFVSNPLNWPDGVPGTGVTGNGPAPSPAHIATSLVHGWANESMATYPLARPLRIAIEATARHSFSRALEFLVEAASAGFVPLRVLVPALHTLVEARASVETDAELVNRCVGVTGWPSTASSWMSAPISFSWVGQSGRCYTAGLPEVLDSAFRSLDRMRGAVDYDSWILANAGAIPVLFSAVSLGKTMSGHLSLPDRASVRQLEENDADAFSFMGTLKVVMDHGHLATAATLSPHSETLRNSELTHATGQRMLRQRVLLPDALATWSSAEQPLPPAWRHASPRLAPLLMAYVTELSFDLTDPSGVPGDKEQRRARVDRLIELSVRGKHEAVIVEARDLLATFPWSTTIRYALAMAQGKSGEPQAALDVLVEAIAIEPTEAPLWRAVAGVLYELDATDEALYAHAIYNVLIRA
jgi:hypothetical protein